MIYVMRRRFAKYDYIVKVHEGEILFNAGHDHVHDTLECTVCCRFQTAYVQSYRDHYET